MESPIDLYDDIIKHEEIEPLVIDDINKQMYAEIFNTGEGINISVSTQNSPIISGGGLPYPEYVVFRILFRWDSEHTINNEKFAMEIQVLTIAKKCLNFDYALAKGGVAVFSTLYTLSHQENKGLEELLPIIPFISDEINRVVPYDVVRLAHFFPKNFNEYYRYNGSLTFPPFTSGVVWTIFKEKQPVTRPQMGLLCDILNEDGNLIVHNNSASRNKKTVLYSSGKIKKKCECPPRHRKHKSKNRREECDIDEINEIFVESEMHESQRTIQSQEEVLKDQKTDDLSSNEILEEGKIMKDVKSKEEENEMGKKEMKKLQGYEQGEKIVTDVENKRKQTDGVRKSKNQKYKPNLNQKFSNLDKISEEVSATLSSG